MTRSRTAFLFLNLLIGVLLTGCSMQRLAVRSTQGILERGLEVMYEEDDLPLAEQAVASNLKLIEALVRSDPNNKKLLLMASQGYSSYALGFVEDSDPERARKFYARGRDYGLRILLRKEQFRKALNADLEQFKEALRVFSKNDVPALFWTANGWGNWINLGLSDPNALAQLPKVRLLMERVLQLDEGYFYGSAHLFFGSLYGGIPKMLGGDPAKSRRHFERCLEINKGRFLMTYVLYARYYAVQVQDRALFEKLLRRVLDATLDILPEQRLANAIAQRKAAALLAKVDDLFL
jgi:tetratricopeptide (TPR) repeat protein